MLYKGCGHHHEVIAAVGPNEFDKQVDEAIGKLYQGKLVAGQLSAELYLAVAEKLWEQVKKNYGKAFTNIAYDKPDLNRLHYFKNNVFRFSAAKNFHQMVEMSELLSDENGVPLGFQEFKEKALNIHNKYNINWLGTEYRTAKRTARAAGLWQRYEEQKDLFDLQFDTAGDDKVRDDHKRFDGITLPVDHPFWNRNYPPIDHECRCGTRQVAIGTSRTPDIELKGLPQPPKAFQFNPGKQKIIYSDEHPYIKELRTGGDGGTKIITKELEAERHYGLKSVDDIYSRPSNLSAAPEGFGSKDEMQEWWDKLKNSKGIKIVNARTGMSTRSKIVLDDKAVKHIADDNTNDRWAWMNSVIDAMENPSEVYEFNYQAAKGSKVWPTYRFVKYYNDEPVVVNAEIREDMIRVRTAYKAVDKDGNKLDMVNDRKGILQYQRVK